MVGKKGLWSKKVVGKRGMMLSLDMESNVDDIHQSYDITFDNSGHMIGHRPSPAVRPAVDRLQTSGPAEVSDQPTLRFSRHKLTNVRAPLAGHPRSAWPLSGSVHSCLHVLLDPKCKARDGVVKLTEAVSQ